MKTKRHSSFLVFSGGNDRAVLGFLRALASCGERAHIIARTSKDRVLRTNYRQDVKWIRPDHSLSMDTFAECVKRVRDAGVVDKLVILPSTEYFNRFLLENRHEVESMGCSVPLVQEHLYSTLTEKHASTRFFASAGIAVPEEMESLGPEDFPAVAKPRLNISPNGESLYPELLETREDVVAFLRRETRDHYFFQRFIHGQSYYLLFHLTRGGASFAWSQRNLLQQPSGKSMLLAERSDFHKSSTAHRIIQSLIEAGFHGLGMVEVIRGLERDVFIEMNPRIWGPAQLCVDHAQPVLPAFIGEALQGDAAHYINRTIGEGKGRYFWCGGLLEVLVAGQRPAWHCARRSLFGLALLNLRFDIYLRIDSWRIFIHDIRCTIKALLSYERHKS